VAVEHPKEHPIADGELEFTMVGVVEPAGVLLSLEKTSTHLLKELIPVGEQGVHRLRARLPRGVGQQVWGWPTVHHLERGGLERRVIGRVVAKLGPWEPIQPITRAITCQTPKILGNCLVDSFRLPICLRVERRTHAELDADVTEEVAPHMTRHT
jgi:hypothetical protein